jgi:signal transduction histidine kinase
MERIHQRSGGECAFDQPRLRTYRLLVYLATAFLIAGGSGTPSTLVSTASVYLGLGLIGVGLHWAIRRGRSTVPWIWPAVLLLDVVAQAFVVGRMGGSGSPFLLLLALPILVWGVLRGLSGGIWAAALTVAADGVLLALSRGAGDGLRSPQSSGILMSYPGQGLIGLLLHSAAFLLLGGFSGLLGRRIRQEEASHRETRRELEQAHLDAESIVAQLSQGLLCLDSRGRITLQNGRAKALLAPWGGLAVGSDLTEIPLHSPLYPLTGHLLDRLGDSREQRHEILLGGRDGSDPLGLPCEVSTKPILDAAGQPRGLMILLHDLTVLRSREDERQHRERLAVIGELSAGLAHEIRNSLKPITGSVELLRREMPAGCESQDALMEIILRESESLENFLTEFLNFARDKNLQMETLPLERVLGEELSSLNALPDSPFRLTGRSQDAERLCVRIDRGALRQAVRNLGINALEAGGAPIEVGWRRHGAEAVIFMRDHGPGIPPELRRKVLEPFFTTKPQGTGLGLAIARDLINRLGGRLILEPADGGGTCACIHLPLVEGEHDRAEGRAAAEETRPVDLPGSRGQARAA